MEHINGKTWLGFVINIVVTAVFYGMGVMDGATIFFGVGLLLTGVGIAMLVNGYPAGGIFGAVGSAFFVPIGIICMIGCLQSRDRLRNAALTTAVASGSEEIVTRAEEASVAPDAPAASDGTSATKEAPVMMTAAEPCAEAAAAPAASENTPAPEQAPVTTAETPLAAYGFVDERMGGWLLVLLGIAAFFFGLSLNGQIMSGSVVCLVIGIIRIIQTQQRLDKHVCVLYRDRLECVVGLWTGDLVNIPYAAIREAECSDSKLRLQLASGAGTSTATVYFGRFASAVRDEARTVLRDKLRELGVLREN